MLKRMYTFDEVALVPQFNNIRSRTEPSLETWLTKTRKMDLPILASNMDSVIGPELARILIRHGIIPIFHRFVPLEELKKWIDEFKDTAFFSIGFNQFEHIDQIIDWGVKGLCIDVAHGHSVPMTELIGKIKRKYPMVEVIAGNVCTAMAYHDLVNAGADAVKVGIGPGAACTTRIRTGFGVPQFSAILECGELAKKLRVPIIADGGIKSSRELVLALAAGASSIMMGKLFAGTMESAAKKEKCESAPFGWKAKYRGQASRDFQEEFYGGLRETLVDEGVAYWVHVTGKAESLLSEFRGGLSSGMTYGGARTIKELQRKAEFIEVGSGYLEESCPRPGGEKL